MKLLRAMIIIALSFQPVTSMAEQTSGTNVGADLPPKVRTLLLQEMTIILETTKDILEAMVRGQNEVVAKKAQAIHDSFIMKQEMTAADKKALKASVPNEFLERDQAFHQLAARLAEAARKEDNAAQNQLFSEMINACAECHSKHAMGQFPEFSSPD
ncbi:cytochrome c [Marinimicrobium locisalis]|uniref:cytochrome c n=1 Tax=Marinimicrobium locisalis TaxID=546022 RepID=UPI003221DF39